MFNKDKIKALKQEFGEYMQSEEDDVKEQSRNLNDVVLSQNKLTFELNRKNNVIISTDGLIPIWKIKCLDLTIIAK